MFTRTRHGADRVTRQLARYGVKAVPIHGRRSQAQRDQALKQFSTGRAPALIATDVAARGIHVDAVGCVVHFDLPDDPKDYVHRSGRTGRAGASGTVVALVGDDARKAARTLQRALGRDEPFEPADASKLPAAEPFVASRLDEVDGARTSERAEHGHNGGRSSGRGARSERSRGDRSRGDRSRPAADRDRDDRDRRNGADRRDRPVRAESGRPRRPGRAERNGRDHGDVRVDRNGHDDRGGVVSGTVSSYNPQRGYGFISRRGGGDVFVHVSALPGREPTLEAGQRVRFELAPGKRGQQARNVRPVA